MLISLLRRQQVRIFGTICMKILLMLELNVICMFQRHLEGFLMILEIYKTS